MAKKIVGIILSYICFFFYVLLIIGQYFLYIGALQGMVTLGGYVVSSSMLQSCAIWLIRIAAFFPLVLFFRRIIHWNRGVKCCMLIAAIVVPVIFSSIGASIHSQCVDAISNGKIMAGAFSLYILLNGISNAISTLIWVAAANGIGLLGKIDYQQNMSIDSTVTAELMAKADAEKNNAE